MYALADCNNFFASCERVFRPELNGRPLIGCDNQFFTPFLTPPLTTVDLHPFDHGAVAVRELINAMEGGGHAFSQIRECSLIVRESCGSLLGIRPELGEQKTSR